MVVIVYVLGGPGSGKTTQCSKIAKAFDFVHLRVSELLQAQVNDRSPKVIEDSNKTGNLVPSEKVVKALQEAMQKSKQDKFLVDGFPRNEENRLAAENIPKMDPTVVLVLECSLQETTRRLLNRNEGRADDSNIETILKRYRVYEDATLPVINYYSIKGKVHKIDAERSIDEVFNSIKDVFARLQLGNQTH